MMDAFQWIAERRIQEAMDRGEFDRLSLTGRPLDLREDAAVPPDLRLAYKVLTNAGFLPSELELRKEITSLRELIQTLDNDAERIRRVRELQFKLLKLNLQRRRPVRLEGFPEYEVRVVERLTRGHNAQEAGKDTASMDASIRR